MSVKNSVKNWLQKDWFQSVWLPQSLDFWCKQFRINYQTQTATAKVVTKKVLQDSVKLVLKTSSSFGSFKAGQHVRLKLDIEGIGTERCYSIANLPNKQGYIELYIKVQGVFSNAVLKRLKTGQVLDISQPFGNNSENDFDTFIAGGIGITAMWPLFLEQFSKQTNELAKNGTPNKKLLYLTRLNSENLSVDTSDTSDTAETKTVLMDVIAQSGLIESGHVQILDGRTVLSSPDELERMLAANGAVNQSVISCGSEKFNDVIKSKIDSSGLSITLIQERFNGSHNESENANVEIKDDIKITLVKSETTLVLSNEVSLLDSLLNAGVKTNYGCKQGICHQCTCRVSANSLLNDTGKIIQLCTTFPTQDMELEL